jgi:5-methylcytosine-specific restriction endonuclease McrA
MDYAEYLQSAEWRARADAVFEREHGRCQRCGGPASEVHHKTYERIFCEPLSDLEAMCKRCHLLIHGRLVGSDAERQERKQDRHQDRHLRDLYAPRRR